MFVTFYAETAGRKKMKFGIERIYTQDYYIGYFSSSLPFFTNTRAKPRGAGSNFINMIMALIVYVIQI